MKLFLLICLTAVVVGVCHGKGSHKVHCSEDWMRVEIVVPTSVVIDNDKDNNKQPDIYLEGMKGYPNQQCQPKLVTDSLYEFKLSLKDFYECGVTRVINKINGKKVYYHKIIIENDSLGKGKEIVSVKCITTGPVYNVTNEHHGIVRRDTLPLGFQEPEDLEITTSLIERAPEPILGVGVRQGDNVVTGELNVSPGTPLTMEIFLDKSSAPVYGLGVTYMQVTDTKSQEETIIFNGCSVDPYLFDNFNTIDGDFLQAKFRAFKFPESTYVQFRGTVNVCLDKCSGVQCSNGQVGYGRRKREISSPKVDPNKIYEISMTTFIKVNYEEGVDPNTVSELEQKIKQLKIANQKLARNSRGSVFDNNNNNNIDRNIPEQTQPSSASASSAESAQVEETIIFRTDIESNAMKCIFNYLSMLPLLLFVIKLFS